MQHNQYTYSALIAALGKSGRWARALAVHTAMEADEVGVVGNVYTYSAVISACEKGGQWKEAMKVR
jgi:pentatricopeptide repeat domain-containing protein 1